MFIEAGLEDYAEELREQVCRRCVARVQGAPPCAPKGIGCGVEQHLAQLVEICHSVDSPLIDPYQEELYEKVCTDCVYRDQPVCPCPLKYLLPLAISAVETVDRRRRLLGENLARAFCGVQDTD